MTGLIISSSGGGNFGGDIVITGRGGGVGGGGFTTGIREVWRSQASMKNGANQASVVKKVATINADSGKVKVEFGVKTVSPLAAKRCTTTISHEMAKRMKITVEI